MIRQMEAGLGETRPIIAEAIGAAADRLADAGLQTPRLDAEVLLRHVLGVDRTRLFARLREPMSPEDATHFAALIERRRAGAPVAYLTGRREFMALTFAVGPGVLIPRPETETLVEWALARLEGRAGATIVDVGTGSGAIALSIAAARPGLNDRIVGVDVSFIALAYARANREALGLLEAVPLIAGNLVDWCAGPVDLLLANLPYLRPDQRAGNPELAAEPEIALTSGDDGLAAIRRLLAEAPRVLAADGAIALEVAPTQATAVRAAAQTALPAARVSVLRDLAGWDRVVVAEH